MTTTNASSTATTTDERPGEWISLAPYGLGKYEVWSPGGYGLDESQWPVRHKAKGTFLKVTLGTNGYPQVKLYPDQGKQKTREVHALLLLANAEPPEVGMEARHLDSDPLNYRWAAGNEEETKAAGGNLIYGTKKQNHADQVAAGTATRPTAECINYARCGGTSVQFGRRCLPCLKEVGVDAAKLLRSGMSGPEVAVELGYEPRSERWVVGLALSYGGYKKPAARRPHRKGVLKSILGQFRRKGRE